MNVALLAVLITFLVLFAVFGIVFNRVREDDAAHPLATFLAVSFSALSALAVLLVPVIMLLVFLLAVQMLYPEAVYYRTFWYLFATVFVVSLGLFVYELLLEGYLVGFLKYFGLHLLIAWAVEGLFTAGLILIVAGLAAQSVGVSWGAALFVGAASASVSYVLEARP